MGDTDARKRELEFRRDLTRQHRLPADDATTNGERQPFSAFRDDLRRAWARSRDDVWLQVLVFLLVIALLLVFFPLGLDLGGEAGRLGTPRRHRSCRTGPHYRGFPCGPGRLAACIAHPDCGGPLPQWPRITCSVDATQQCPPDSR
jgi:hypothetical protein